MHVADLRTLYAYSCWMNDRILAAAERVTPEQFVAPTDLTPRNLQDNLVHILDVEWSWRERARGAPREIWIAELETVDFPDVPALRARWAEESATMREYLASLTDAQLQAPLDLEGREVALGAILLHAINHGILARVEAAVLLTQYGQSPGDLDVLDYVDPRP
jgi:uncharacterized damage-inducible protein DinB